MEEITHYIPYTIVNFKTYLTRQEQEAEVLKAFKHWTDLLPGVEPIYFPDAKRSDVFMFIDLSHPDCGDGIGCGAGNGPNTYGFAALSNLLFYIDTKPKRKVAYKFKVTMAHELGHALGLSHYRRTACQMYTNAGGQSLIHCPEEVEDLQDLWEDAVCTSPTCKPNSVVEGFFRGFKPLKKFDVHTGEITKCRYSLRNDGDVDYLGNIVILDITDNKVILFRSVHIPVGKIFKGFFDWDTLNASVGIHHLRGTIYDRASKEMDLSDNVYKRKVDVKA